MSHPYDLNYAWKDYERESRKLHWLIKHASRTDGKDLLDVACGTGGHAQYLCKHYKIVGVDKGASMLREARRKLPGLRFVRGDFRTFKVAKRFDVLTCLFGSFGYLTTRAAQKKALLNFRRHLKPGGLCIIEPYLRRGRSKRKCVTFQGHVLMLHEPKAFLKLMDECGYDAVNLEKGLTADRDLVIGFVRVK